MEENFKPVKKRWYVYMVRCADNSLYTGISNDVEERVKAHNAGKGARTTRGRAWVLLHSEAFASKPEAMSREWHLKHERAFRKKLAQKIKS